MAVLHNRTSTPVDPKWRERIRTQRRTFRSARTSNTGQSRDVAFSNASDCRGLAGCAAGPPRRPAGWSMRVCHRCRCWRVGDDGVAHGLQVTILQADGIPRLRRITRCNSLLAVGDVTSRRAQHRRRSVPVDPQHGRRCHGPIPSTPQPGGAELGAGVAQLVTIPRARLWGTATCCSPIIVRHDRSLITSAWSG